MSTAGAHFEVEGRTRHAYRVIYREGTWTCSCPDFAYRHRQCRHIRAARVAFYRFRAQGGSPQAPLRLDTYTVDQFCDMAKGGGW
jgi:hypothetical protein